MREFVFPLVSLGSSAVQNPNAADVSKWISGMKGNTADIITYNLHACLASQKPYAAEPAAGGDFYQPRIEEMLGSVDGSLKQEPVMQMDSIFSDLRAVKIKGCGFAVPAFSDLALEDKYLHDADEFEADGVEAYKKLSRELRDAGAARTILHAESPGELELEALHGKKYLWVTPASSLERVLEVSRDVVIEAADVSRLEELFDSYEIRYVYVKDADREALATVLSLFDKEYVFTAGYCNGEKMDDYWQSLSELKVKITE